MMLRIMKRGLDHTRNASRNLGDAWANLDRAMLRQGRWYRASVYPVSRGTRIEPGQSLDLPREVLLPRRQPTMSKYTYSGARVRGDEMHCLIRQLIRRCTPTLLRGERDLATKIWRVRHLEKWSHAQGHLHTCEKRCACESYLRGLEIICTSRHGNLYNNCNKKILLDKISIIWFFNIQN